MMASQFRKARDERTEDVARITNPLSAMSRGGGGKIVNRIRQKQNPLGVLSQSQFNQRESLEGQIRVDCRQHCFACGILPTFNSLRRENPGDYWKCPVLKAPAQTVETALPVLGV